MLAYGELLQDRGYQVLHIPVSSDTAGELFRRMNEEGVRSAAVAEPTDHELESKMRDLSSRYDIEIEEIATPSFITPKDWITEHFRNREGYRLTEFYIAQRRRLGILVKEGSPAGGRWTFDVENRKRLPDSVDIPRMPETRETPYTENAKKWVEDNFDGNPGEVESFNFPVDHGGALGWFETFLRERLVSFGDYQDSISREEPLLFHSLISPMLNIGLLTPGRVVDLTLKFSEEKDVPLNSLEGFLRQVIGWREFVRAVYLLEGESQRESNFWNHTRPLPDAIYEGTTGIDPVDRVVKRVKELAYAHHIERLMVVGNYMLLCEVDPKEAYRWFMEMFIDAFDWVMVPNIFGMSQYADGGMMTTKPYICSSNYILRMSDFSKGDWCERLDALFWRFVDKHEDSLRKNPRSSLIVSNLERMDADRRERLKAIAEDYVRGLK